VLMGRETSSLHLLAPLLLTGGKGANLVIRGNVVLNLENSRTLRWRWSTLHARVWSANAMVTGLETGE
jgi:hypothetical protein